MEYFGQEERMRRRYEDDERRRRRFDEDQRMRYDGYDRGRYDNNRDWRFVRTRFEDCFCRRRDRY